MKRTTMFEGHSKLKNCPQCNTHKYDAPKGEAFQIQRKSSQEKIIVWGFSTPKMDDYGGEELLYGRTRLWLRHKCKKCGWTGKWRKYMDTMQPSPRMPRQESNDGRGGVSDSERAGALGSSGGIQCKE